MIYLIFQVTEHKTAAQAPAMIALSPELLQMIKNFHQIVKKMPCRSESNQLFLTWPKEGPAKAMSSSLVNKAIQRAWSGGPVQKKINATRIRKSTSTAVREAFPESRELLARHMSHSTGTADKYYALHDQQKLARPIGNLIESVMHRRQSQVQKSIHWPSTSHEITESENQEEGIVEAGQSGQETEWVMHRRQEQVQKSIQWPSTSHEIAESGKEEEGIVKAGQSGEDTEDYSETEITKPDSPLNDLNLALSDEEKFQVVKFQEYHKRRSFSEDEAQSLIRLCEGNLRSGQLKKLDIMTRLQETQEGRILILKIKERNANRDFWKMIVDRIHAERRRRKRSFNKK